MNTDTKRFSQAYVHFKLHDCSSCLGGIRKLWRPIWNFKIYNWCLYIPKWTTELALWHKVQVTLIICYSSLVCNILLYNSDQKILFVLHPDRESNYDLLVLKSMLNHGAALAGWVFLTFWQATQTCKLAVTSRSISLVFSVSTWVLSAGRPSRSCSGTFRCGDRGPWLLINCTGVLLSPWIYDGHLGWKP